jgi:hypothetical protein
MGITPKVVTWPGCDEVGRNYTKCGNQKIWILMKNNNKKSSNLSPEPYHL